MKISPERQIELTDDIIHSTAEDFSLDVTSWESVDEGIGNIVAKINTNNGLYYGKFYNLDHSLERLDSEVELITALQDAGNVPLASLRKTVNDRPYTTKEGQYGSHFVTLTEGVPGSHPQKYSRELVGKIALAHANIHVSNIVGSGSKPLDILEDYHYVGAEDLGVYFDADSLARESLQRIRDQWSSLPSGLTHLDISTSNVLAEGDSLNGIIDFEDTSMAPYVFCLAGALWDILEINKDMSLVDSYTQTYESIRPLSDLERRTLKDMTVVRGWLALHGTLLTRGNSEKSRKQLVALANLAT